MSYPYYSTNSTGSQYLLSAVQIQGTNISSAGANDNDVLTYDLATDQWQPEPLPAPPAVNTIYTADGTITGNRTLTTGANSLTLTNGSTASIALNNPAGTIALTSASITLPTIPNSVETNSLYYDTVSKEISYGTAPADTNIYTIDGTLTGNRSVNTSTNRFRITNNTTDFIDVNNPINAGGVLINSQVGDINLFAQGVGTADISLVADNNITVQSANNMTVQGSTKVDVISGGAITLNGTSIKLTNAPAIANSNTNILTRNSGNGNVEIRTVASLPDTNVYNSNGTLLSGRTITTAGYPLTITDGTTNQLNISPIQTDVNNAVAVSINSPSVVLATAPPTDITNTALLTRDATTGAIELRDVSTLPVPIPTGTANAVAGYDGSGNLSSLSSSYTSGSNVILASSSFLQATGGNNTIISGINANQFNCNNVCSLIPNLTTNLNATQCLTVGSFCVMNGCSGSVMINDRQATNNNNTINDTMKIRMTNGVNITNAVSNNNNASSAVLQIDSTTAGVILPRMTSTNRINIVSPVNGLIVYDTILSSLQLYTSAWKYLRANAVEIAETPVSALTPTNGQILQLVAGTWTPSTLPVSTFIRLNPNGNFANNQYIQTGGQSATESAGQSLIYQTSTLLGFRVNLVNPAGVGNSRTFTLRVNGVNTALVITLTGTATTGTATGSISLVAGDLVSCLHTASGAAASQGQIVIAINQS